MKLIRNAIFALLLCLLCLLILRSAQPLRDPGRLWVGGAELTWGGEAPVGGGSAVYDAETLRYRRSIPWNPGSGQVECCGLAVDADRGHVWMADWVNGEALYCYDLATSAYVGKVLLHPVPQLQQGICSLMGRMLISCDDGDAEKDEADRLYICNLYNPDGSLARDAEVRLFRTMDDFRRTGEIEGLTVNSETGAITVLSNRGARIILGMPKGFYEGYDREIHELYTYIK